VVRRPASLQANLTFMPRVADIVPVASDRRRPVARTVLLAIVLGLLVLLLVGGVGIAVLSRVAKDESIQEAQGLAAVSARIMQPRIDDGIIRGDAAASVKVATIATDAILHDPVVAVRLYGPDGTILYANDLRLIGRRVPSVAPLLTQLAPGEVQTERISATGSDAMGVSEGTPLLASRVALHTPNGTPVMLQIFQRFSSVADSRRHLLETFAPVLIVALIAMAALLVPLAWILARRVERASADRELAMRRALEIVDLERRRIAADLHDGPVQELAGVAMGLSADAKRLPDEHEREVLSRAAEAVRGSIRALRSAIVGIYPPNLHASGLGPALSDLTARLPSDGLAVSLDVPQAAAFGADADALLFRACQEALRNVEEHANAAKVSLRVFRDGDRAVLEVRDDGRGVSQTDAAAAQEDGHVGLTLLDAVLRDGGGTLRVVPADGGGTLLRVEVPAA
jgi:two-component system, NarL family, sensor kinase